VDSATEVRYGGVVVGRSPQLRDRTDAGAFVVFGEPLPVGTSLVLKIDDKDQLARVTEVVESADASAAGMRVRFLKAGEKAAPAPATAQPATAAVQPATAAVQPVAATASAPVPVSASPPAAVAAPVVVAVDEAPGSAGVPSAADASAPHAADSRAHHDGEHGRRKRRRK
jgi:hypothetical protein